MLESPPRWTRRGASFETDSPREVTIIDNHTSCFTRRQDCKRVAFGWASPMCNQRKLKPPGTRCCGLWRADNALDVSSRGPEQAEITTLLPVLSRKSLTTSNGAPVDDRSVTASGEGALRARRPRQGVPSAPRRVPFVNMRPSQPPNLTSSPAQHATVRVSHRRLLPDVIRS